MDNQLLSLLQNASLGPRPPGNAASPPPPAASASIDRLFASLTSPPPAQQQPAAQLNGSNGDQGGRQAQLLGLLKGAQAGAAGAGAEQARSSPSPSQASEPQRGGATSPAQGRAQDLLASLFGKLPQSPGEPSISHGPSAAGPGVPHTEPLINHLSPPPTESEVPLPVDVSRNSGDEARRAGTPSRSELAPPPPPSQGAPTFTSAVFKFVSPFDAFEDIKPATSKVSTLAPAPAAAVPAPSTAPAAESSTAKNKPVSRHQSPAPSATSKARSDDAAAAASPATSSGAPERFGSPRPEDVPPPKVDAPPAPKAAASRVASTSTPSKKKNPVEEFAMPYTARQHVKAGKGSATRALSGRDIVFDVAAPNTDGLAHSPDSARERKISAVKTDTFATGLSGRRTLAVSDTLLAYVLSKGGIRVLDQGSAANALLAIEDDGQVVKAATLDVVDGYVAAALEDGSIAVWKVEEGAGGDSLANELLFRTRPQGAGVQQVFWWKQDDKQAATAGNLGLLWVDGRSVSASPLSEAVKELRPARAFSLQGDDVVSANVLGGIVAVASRERVRVFDVKNESAIWQVDLKSDVTELGDAAITGVTALSTTDVLVELDQGRKFLRLSDKGQTLASIQFQIPAFPDMPSGVRTAAARWDAENRIVWIPHFLRGSLIGLATSRHVDGVQPIFTRLTEIPLEPLGDANVKPSGGSANGSVEVFYKFARGFSQISVDPRLIAELVADRPSEEAVALAPAQEEPATSTHEEATPAAPQPKPAPSQPESASAQASTAEPQPSAGKVLEAPAPVPRAEPSVPTPAAPSKQTANNVPESRSTGASLEEVTAAIKKSEDRLADKINKGVQKELNKLRDQQNQRLDTIAKNASFSADAHAKQLAGFETTLAKAVQASFDDSALPNLEVILDKAITEAINSQLPRTIEHAVKHSVTHEFERNVIPHIGHALTSGLSPAIENHMRSMVQTVVLPQLSAAVHGMAGNLGEMIHREMLEVRKSISQEQSLEMRQSHQSMQNMSTTLSSLIEQVKMLTAEVQTLRAQRPAPADMPPVAPLQAAARGLSPPGGIANGPAPIPAPLSAVPGANDMPEDAYEDHFLSAFGDPDDQRLIAFVMDKYPRIKAFLPDPGMPSPLSQAVLLTIVYRLTKILRGDETGKPEFQCALSWVFRAAQLIDRHSPVIASHIQLVFANSRAHLVETSRVSSLAPDARAPYSEQARVLMARVISLLSM